MGLAVLEYEGNEGQHALFRADLGSNRYWAYAVGDQSHTQSGIRLLKNKRFISPLMGPLRESSRGRTSLRVPLKLFDRENRSIQLMSFRSKDRIGPAVSSVCQVRTAGSENGDLPQISFSKELTKVSQQVENIPFNIKESRMSESMFLGALTSLLPSILPSLGGLLGGLFGGKGGNGKGGGGVANLLQSIAKPEIIKLISNLVKQISGAKSMAAQEMSVSSRLSKGERPLSEAMIAPALLAALPALMPLLKQVLTPETMKSLLDGVNPNKAIGAVTDSIAKIGNLGLKGQQQLMGHIEKLHRTDDPLDKLVENLSLARTVEPSFIFTENVKIHFEGLKNQRLYGKRKTLYRFGQDLAFPVRVETPRKIKNAILQIVIKEPETLEIVDQKKWKITDVDQGRMENHPSLKWGRISSLKSGEDYLISIILTWKNKKGKRFGTSREMLVTIVPDFAFDRVEEFGDLIALNNPATYREFWHKIWQGPLSQTFKGLDLECKYYYTLNSTSSSHAKMQTVMSSMEGSGLKQKKGKLKSGMVFSLDALNELIPRISSNPILESNKLDALRMPDFSDRFQQAATANISLRGKEGDSISLWTYPVFKLQKVFLKKISNVNEYGHVVEMEEHPVYFPMPVIVHFVGLNAEK